MEGCTDFIAIDLDKHDVWAAFRQPVPVKAQMYVKTANWNAGPPPCSDVAPGDLCTAADQLKVNKINPLLQGIDPRNNPTSPQAGGELDGENTGGPGGLTEEQMACAKEQKKDDAAQSVLEEILTDILSGELDASLEHGAPIVNVDGQIYALPIVTGTATMISLSTFVSGENGLIASNLSWSNIVGVIHRHPVATRGSETHRRNTDIFNRGPSEGDVGLAETFSQLGDGQNVTTYIISPEGDLLQYEGYEQPSWVGQSFSDEEIEEAIESLTSENETDAAGEECT